MVKLQKSKPLGFRKVQAIGRAETRRLLNETELAQLKEK
jgi:TrmH family RNA methyltransferase